MERQGDLCSGEDGTEESAGFPQLRPVTPTLASGVQTPWRQRIATLGMQASCWGSRVGVGTLQATEGTRVPREPPPSWKSLSPGHRDPHGLPGNCHGAWYRSPRPRFAAGECLLWTSRTGGCQCLHGQGGTSSGGPRRSDNTPFLGGLAQSLES